MSRRLVLTADDLGRDPADDEVIAGALEAGVVTATTLIPLGPHARAAAHRMRRLGVVPRLHATLTRDGGRSWAPLSPGRSLTTPDGLVHEDPVHLAAHAATAEVVAELDAQLGWMRTQGFAAPAADSHAGTLYGLHGRSWLAEALAWCARHGLAFRLPRDPVPYAGPLPAGLGERHAEAVHLADRLGVPIPETVLTNRRSATELGSYEALRDDLCARLATLPEGTSELFLHPGAGLEDDEAVRGWEARLLGDPLWREALVAADVELVAGWWP